MVCEMLLRKNKIWIMEEKEDMTQRNALNDLSVATLMKNIEPLGYTFSRTFTLFHGSAWTVMLGIG